MADNKGSGGLEIAFSFLIGAAAGFVLGVLFAPASGKETRQKIKVAGRQDGRKSQGKLREDQPGSRKRHPGRERKGPGRHRRHQGLPRKEKGRIAAKPPEGYSEEESKE